MTGTMGKPREFKTDKPFFELGPEDCLSRISCAACPKSECSRRPRNAKFSRILPTRLWQSLPNASAIRNLTSWSKWPHATIPGAPCSKLETAAVLAAVEQDKRLATEAGWGLYTLCTELLKDKSELGAA